MADPASPLLDAARAWHDAGFCVIPSHEDGSKRPFGQWKKYQHERPDWPTLERWLLTGRYTGIGLIMGQASGNTEMIELEGPDLSSKLGAVFNLAKQWDDTDQLGAGDLLWRVYNGCSEESAGGGLHIFVRVTDGLVPGNTKLAMGDNKVIAETRGEGGFVIVWPTPARTGHQPDAAYMMLTDSTPAAVAHIDTEELQFLHHLFAEAFGAMPETPEPPQPNTTLTPAQAPGALSPFDDYRHRTTWRDILEPAGWTYSHKDNEHDYWVRPGKDPRDGHSASTIEDGPLYLFSTSVAGMPTEIGLSKAQVYAHLHHNGDLSNATRQLRTDGYGEPYTSPAPLAEFHAINQQPPDDNNPTYSDLTWVITGQRREPPAPTWLTTSRGDRLFYTARVNGLFGDPETAKSWIAMCAVTEALHENERCAYLDVDHNGADEIASRLLALGAPAHAIADPAIFRVYEPEDRPSLLQFVIDMHQWTPAITVVDSLGEIIPMLGLNSSDNDDLTHAIRAVLKPLAHKVGSCVITVDHLPKSTEARQSGYAIGGIAKKRAVDGAYYSCDSITPTAPGKIGKVRLIVEKDRHGHVRQAAVGKIAGDFVLDSTGPKTTWKITTPEAALDGREKPTGAMEEVSKYLETQPYRRAASKNAIITALVEVGPFKKNTLDRAITALADDNHIHVAPKARKTDSQEVTLVTEYRELGNVEQS